jgi:protein SERAC1
MFLSLHMQALLASRNSADDHLQSMLKCTYGILFLGTPHSGSALAKWAEHFAQSIGLIKQANLDIIRLLKSDSEVLARIQSDFHTMVRAKQNAQQNSLKIVCFYEELPIPGVGLVSELSKIKACNLTQACTDRAD